MKKHSLLIEPLETRVALFLDDQEISIVIHSLKVASNVAEMENNPFLSRLIDMITMKAIGAKVRNQDRNIEILEQLHGIK